VPVFEDTGELSVFSSLVSIGAVGDEYVPPLSVKGLVVVEMLLNATLSVGVIAMASP
jgi:hypothetical protein